LRARQSLQAAQKNCERLTELLHRWFDTHQLTQAETPTGTLKRIDRSFLLEL
jgi:hypothetical protein